MKLIYTLLTGLVLCVHTAKAQEKPFVIGAVDELRSVVLSENRILNVYLPDKYAADASKTYPVIYLLDGSANDDFIHVAGLVQFLTMIKKMPASIVVGIANVDRKRDFTFPTTISQDQKDLPTSGGSEKFIAFLEKEAQPFIEKKYRTNSSKTLIGQSLGALLATEVLLKKPALFNRYMIVSPSLWWDNESLLTKAPDLLKARRDQKVQVYVAVGKEGKVMENDALKLSETLKEYHKENMEVDFLFFAEENHATILHRALYKGFEILNAKK